MSFIQDLVYYINALRRPARCYDNLPEICVLIRKYDQHVWLVGTSVIFCLQGFTAIFSLQNTWSTFNLKKNYPPLC